MSQKAKNTFSETQLAFPIGGSPIGTVLIAGRQRGEAAGATCSSPEQRLMSMHHRVDAASGLSDSTMRLLGWFRFRHSSSILLGLHGLNIISLRN